MKIAYTTLGDSFMFDIGEPPFPEAAEISNETKIFACSGTNNECCYGIIRIADYYVLGKRMAVNNVPDHSALFVFDLNWDLVNQIIIEECLDIHQIAAYRNHVLSTSARTNEIFVTNLETGKSTMSFLPDYFTGDTKRLDWNHINSMHIQDKSIFLYCHNHGESMILEVDIDSVFLSDNMKVKRAYENVGRKGHNVLVVGNKLLSLNSGQGKMMCHGLQTGAKKHVVDLDGRYLRGLEHCGEYIFAGGSFADKDRTERFMDKDIVIFILNSTTLGIVSRLALTRKKNILDILVLD